MAPPPLTCSITCFVSLPLNPQLKLNVRDLAVIKFIDERRSHHEGCGTRDLKKIFLIHMTRERQYLMHPTQMALACETCLFGTGVSWLVVRTVEAQVTLKYGCLWPVETLMHETSAEYFGHSGTGRISCWTGTLRSRTHTLTSGLQISLELIPQQVATYQYTEDILAASSYIIALYTLGWSGRYLYRVLTLASQSQRRCWNAMPFRTLNVRLARHAVESIQESWFVKYAKEYRWIEIESFEIL